MKTYLEIEEFCKLVHLKREVVDDMLSRGALKSKEEGGKIYIEANEGSLSVVPNIKEGELISIEQDPSLVNLPGASFVEKTIGTILNLHEKVLGAKDETLDVLKDENKFLKEALYSMQDLYDEDRNTVETLTTQLKQAQEELEFVKRKYKLMWNKAVENYNKEN
nr:DUF3972 domain-containing protein [Campylobacter sp.]